jgi:phage terminase large subunit
MAKTNRTWSPRVSILVFARAYLGLHLYDWQMRVLSAIQVGYPTAALVCNSGGKSSVVIATAVLWFLYNWPAGRATVISGSWHQVETQLWPAINSYQALPYFADWEFQFCQVKTAGGGFARGISTDDAKKAEGAHESETSPVLYILDEAKALEDRIIDSVMRCTSSFFLITSSAGSAEGRFYDCFNALGDLFWPIKVSSFECPHITDEQRAWDLRYYRSEHNPVYRSKHLSEFDAELTGLILAPAALRRALEQPPSYLQGPRTAFLDFAAGGDENVLAVTEGNRVFVAAAWREINTLQATRQFIAEFRRLNLTPGGIWADEGGLGVTMCDCLDEERWPVRRVNNGTPANRSEAYSNRGSEIWFEAAFSIEGREWILPEDGIFIEQATSRRKEYDAKERLRAESKEDMRRRGIPSPDRADAVFGAIAARESLGFMKEDSKHVHVNRSAFGRTHVSF